MMHAAVTQVAVLRETDGKGPYCSLVMAVVVMKDVLVFVCFAINIEYVRVVSACSPLSPLQDDCDSRARANESLTQLCALMSAAASTACWVQTRHSAFVQVRYNMTADTRESCGQQQST